MKSSTIHLFRHGKPDCPPRRALSCTEYSGWVRAYDAAGVASDPPASLKAWIQTVGVGEVFASTLPRSVQSAIALVGTAKVRSLALFNEAAISTASIPLRMSSSTWTLLGRLMWLSGAASPERLLECRARARAATDILMASAVKTETLLVGHGWMNRMIAKELRQRGFDQSATTGSGYWCGTSFRQSG